MLPGHGRHRPLHPHRLRHATEPQQVRQELSPFLPFHLILWFAGTQPALTLQHSYVAQPAGVEPVLLWGFSDACRSVNPAGSVLSLQDHCSRGESGAALAAGLLQSPVPAAEVPAVGGSTAGQSADTRLRPRTRQIKHWRRSRSNTRRKNMVASGGNRHSFYSAIYSVEFCLLKNLKKAVVSLCVFSITLRHVKVEFGRQMSQNLP